MNGPSRCIERRAPAWLFALLLVQALACAPAPRPGFPPRHLVLVTMAAARPDHMSAYLYPRPTTAWPTTPQQRADGQDLSIDDLAVQGVLFAEAFAQSPAAHVAAASLMTGRSPLAVDLKAGIPASVETLAEAFREAGFHTAAFVAGTELAAVFGLERGFEQFETGLDDKAVIARGITWSRQDFGDGRQRLLWLHLDGPNAPYGAEPVDLAWPDGRPGPLDWVAAYADSNYTGEADGSLEWLERAKAKPASLTGRDLRRLRDLYDAGLSESATMLRRYLVFIEQATAPSGLFDETVIAFCGLTGEELFEHGAVGHGERLREEALRIPMFLRHPQSMTGSRILNTMVEATDLFPSLVEWFELGAREVDGRSLLALTDSYVERGFAQRPPLAILADGSLSARVVGWRAIFGHAGVELWKVGLGRSERVDPSEHPDVLARIRKQLEPWLAGVEFSSSTPASVRALRE